MNVSAEALNIITDLIRRTVDPTELGTHTPALVVASRDGISIENIEHLQAGRARFRGTYSASTISDFTSYCAHRALDPTIFLDAQAGSATAFFNLGDEKQPGHADDRATLKLRPTSPFAAVSDLSRTQFTQRQLADWLEDWSDFVKPFYGEEVRGTLANAIAAVRSIEIKAGSNVSHDDRDFGATRSALEQIEARAKEATLQLPSGFIFTCEPYDGFESVEFRLRLSVTPSDPPKLSLRVIGLDEARERIAQAFVDLVKQGLSARNAPARIYRGAFTP